MLNTSAFFNGISSFWSDLFDDKPLLEDIYKVLASRISDSYAGIMSLPANLRLEDTPIYELRSGSPLYLSTSSRLFIDIGDSDFIAVYGLSDEYGLRTTAIGRLYNSPDYGVDDYIEEGSEFTIEGSGSTLLRGLSELSGRGRFFSRYSKYLVFKNVDPLLYYGFVPYTTPVQQTLSFTVAYVTSSPDIDQLLESEIKLCDLEVGGVTSRVALLAAERTQNNSWKIQFPAEEFLEETELGSVFILLNGIRVPLRFTGPTLDTIDTFVLFSPVSAVDSSAVSNRFIHILTEQNTEPVDGYIESSRSLLNKIISVRQAKLLGVSSVRLESLIASLCDIEILYQDTAIEPIFYIDNLLFRVSAGLREYKLKQGFPLSESFVNSVQNFPLGNSVVSRSECILLTVKFNDAVEISTPMIYPINAGFREAVTVSDINGEFEATLLAVSSNSLVIKLDTGTIPNEGVFIGIATLSDSSTVLFRSYASSSAGSAVPAPAYSAIQCCARVFDISLGDTWWQDSDVFVPEWLWNNGNRRNNLSTGTWRPIVGRVQEHRVGDYGIQVGDASFNSTAWNLFRDIFTRSTVFVSTNLGLPSTPVIAAEYSRQILPLGTALIVDSSNSTIEWFKAPTEDMQLTTLVRVGNGVTQDHITKSTGLGIGEFGCIIVGSIDSQVDWSVISPTSMLVGSTPFTPLEFSIVTGGDPLEVTIDIQLGEKQIDPSITTAQIFYAGGHIYIHSLVVYNLIGSTVAESVIGAELPLLPGSSANTYIDGIGITDTLILEIESNP